MDAADQAAEEARREDFEASLPQLLPMLTDVNKASHKLSRRNVLRETRRVAANASPSGCGFRDGELLCDFLWHELHDLVLAF